MNATEFTDKFKSQFIDAESINLDLKTEFRTISSWDSLTGMSIIVMIEDEYEVKITDVELKACVTVEDVLNSVKSKK